MRFYKFLFFLKNKKILLDFYYIKKNFLIKFFKKIYFYFGFLNCYNICNLNLFYFKNIYENIKYIFNYKKKISFISIDIKDIFLKFQKKNKNLIYLRPLNSNFINLYKFSFKFLFDKIINLKNFIIFYNHLNILNINLINFLDLNNKNYNIKFFKILFYIKRKIKYKFNFLNFFINLFFLNYF